MSSEKRTAAFPSALALAASRARSQSFWTVGTVAFFLSTMLLSFAGAYIWTPPGGPGEAIIWPLTFMRDVLRSPQNIDGWRGTAATTLVFTGWVAIAGLALTGFIHVARTLIRVYHAMVAISLVSQD